jgi:hypothetical protein
MQLKTNLENHANLPLIKLVRTPSLALVRDNLELGL